jgi:hypothetical protein
MLPLLLVAAWTVSSWLLGSIVRWRGFPYLAAILVTSVFGHLGLLAGLAKDFGSAGPVVLASWCSTRSDIGLDAALAMLRQAPWGHAGMLLGCNVGMLLTACAELSTLRSGMSKVLFLLLCNLLMLLGMLSVQYWPLASVGGGMEVTALLMLGQMLFGMSAGMVAAWWIADRLCPYRGAEMSVVGEVGK